MAGGRSRDAAASRGPRGSGAARHAFVRGLRCCCVVPIIAAAALDGFVLAGVHVFFTSGLWSAMPLRLWLRADRATGLGISVSWTIARLRGDPPRLPMVYLLGGSTAREATVDNGASLAASV